MKFSVSQSEMHPCYFVTTDFSQHSIIDGDVVLELTDEEYQRYEKCCIEFEDVMGDLMMRIKELNNEG